MKHILFFIESLSAGGAERVLVTLLNHFDYSKYEVTLMPLVDTGVLRKDVDMSKLHYSPVICEAKTSLLRIWNKIKYKLIYQYLPCRLVNKWIVPQKGIDLYIAFAEGYATKLLSFTLRKKFAWVHADLKTDPWTLKSHIYKDLSEEKKAYCRYDKVICVSRAVEMVMRDYYGIESTVTIHNPIDTDLIVEKAKQPVDFEVPSSFKIVSVGRLVYQKGFDRLIRVISKLRDDGIDLQLFIVGEGPERQYLESIVLDNELQDVVHLVGFLSNPYALMAKMDLFVCSSIAEGYSLAIAEAMTLGLPVMSTNCAGPSELLEFGEYGLLVDNSSLNLYEGIKSLIEGVPWMDAIQNKSLDRSKDFGVNQSLKEFDSLVVQLFNN